MLPHSLKLGFQVYAVLGWNYANISCCMHPNAFYAKKIYWFRTVQWAFRATLHQCWNLKMRNIVFCMLKTRAELKKKNHCTYELVCFVHSLCVYANNVFYSECIFVFHIATALDHCWQQLVFGVNNSFHFPSCQQC